MKKILISAFVTLGLFAISLQGYSQVNFGIKAGMNINNISQDFKEDYYEFGTKWKAGFHVGPMVDISFVPMVGLQTGLIFTRKGFEIDLDKFVDDFKEELGEFAYLLDIDIDGRATASYNYLEVPIHATVNILNFQFFAGPYIGIGVGGKSVIDATLKASLLGEEFTETIDEEYDLIPVFGDYDPDDLDDDEEAFNAFDFGLNFGVGYHIGPILLNAGYSLGLGNMTPGETDNDFDPADRKMSNRVITVSASFYF